ncbi:MAG: molybdopterin dinucleotide binding domain-containing protein, partial [Syntrophales bacterium]|nr:molybdopterin dinucleotide binding domain-containing protein [Syntrophales bacterium]
KGNGDAFGLDWFKTNGQNLKAAYPISQFYGYTQFPNVRHPFYWEQLVYRRDVIKAELVKLQAKGAKPLQPSNDWELAAYHGFPEWRPHPEHKESRTEYDLYAMNYKGMEHFYGTNIDNVWLMEWAKFYNPYIMKIVMHPDAAKAKGVKDGDMVVVESMFGPTYKVEGEVKTSNTTHRQVVAIAGAYGQISANVNPVAKDGANFCALLKLTSEMSVSGNIDKDVKVKVYKKMAKAEINEKAVKTAKAEVNRQGIGGEVR